MFKRGQITIFLVVGILILFITAGGYFLKNKLSVSNFEQESKMVEPLTFKTASLKIYADSCLKEAVLSSIQIVAAQGGYAYFYGETILRENIEIAYHLKNEKVIYPGNYFLENELSLLIKDAFGLCLNKISISPGTEIKTGEMKINLAINQKKIAVKIDYPITILQENKEITLENYQGEYDSNLGYLLKASSELVTILSSQKTIPLNTLSSYDLIIKVMPIGDKSIIYSLVDEQNIVDERNRVNRQPLVFNFAVGR
ncbi:hypothetical protein J4437_02105 [Candidatus Woesearchaeota archaeon]|nr:hypothetical protein [Candidatus Woesearchaeota archaeon]